MYDRKAIQIDRKKLNSLNIVSPSRDILGSLKLATTAPRFNGRIFWAYTVGDRNTTELETIENMCLQLSASESQIVTASDNSYHQVGIPLLGTGSGKLDLLAVAKIFHHQFNNRQDSFKIVLMTESVERFDFLERHADEIEFPLNSYTHSEQYRVKAELSPALNVGLIAKSLSALLDRFPPEKGVIVGIFGRWGRGKTYLMDEIWKEVKKGTATSIAPVRVNFQAWKYQDTPAAWAYLYEQLSGAYLSSKKKINGGQISSSM